ncbi:MAG: EAL domain-containing protein [Alphaproteobacteria bacterium]|nr:EAL domain-containing protein [Alphaproteobacteria bacterium]
MKRHIFPAGTLLFKEGDPRECAYLIDRGEVHITERTDRGAEKVLCILNEGEIFGEMALIDTTPRTASAITAEESEIFVMPRQALENRISGLDPIVSLLVSLLIERYSVTRKHLPESIKQGHIGDFILKVSRYENLPDDLLRLYDTAEKREVARQELKLEEELRAGLDRREFIPYLQPIITLPGLQLAGFEALIRWQHPEKGLVFPDQFIPVAERTNVVQDLDRMMLEQVCEILPVLLKKAGPDIFVSVNLSGINFETGDVVQTVAEILRKSKTNPHNIKFEITESALIGDPALAEDVLQGLKALGVSIALDDFGTGYSSLGYLHKFSIDTLKIDRSFVMQLHDNGNRGLDIIRAIVGLARNFKLEVVAEGIEKERDVVALNSLGCDFAQGYLFSKPLPLSDALTFIETPPSWT